MKITIEGNNRKVKAFLLQAKNTKGVTATEILEGEPMIIEAEEGKPIGKLKGKK